MDLDFLRDYDSLSIIGMCKNAGKTTVFNHILEQSYGYKLGLTSIGRDGEATDLVTGTKKPGIWVREGTIIATAAGLLNVCDITREILLTTGMYTPMGEVVVLRALSDGNVQIAGPSMIDQLIEVSRIFKDFGAQKVIIDGAISRKTLCSRELTDATVLCTGASCGRSMEAVIEETRHACRMLTLPETKDKSRFAGLGGKVTLLAKDTLREAEGNLADALRSQKDTDTIFCGGALSDALLKPLIVSGMDLKGMVIVVRDASRILLTGKTYDKLLIKGCKVEVLDPINLVAVTINPFSAYGLHFDKDVFLAEMSRQLPVPVLNVEEENL